MKRTKYTNNIERILSEHFDAEAIEYIRKSRLSCDNAGILRVKELSRKSLQQLFDRKVCAIHVPDYFSKTDATRAKSWILENSRIENWVFPGGVKTDMNYGIGLPRKIADCSLSARKKYIRDAVKSLRKVRKAFAPSLSPMDRLRLELDEVWKGGAGIQAYRGENGFAGLVRIMLPKDRYPGIAGKKGICHVDGMFTDKIFSSNLYVNVPKKGGELRIWNVKLDKRTSSNPVYMYLLLQKSFSPDVQEVLYELLPKPLVLKPKVGDLVILDTGRPHAVAGFDQENRISIQAFIQYADRDNKIELFS